MTTTTSASSDTGKLLGYATHRLLQGKSGDRGKASKEEKDAAAAKKEQEEREAAAAKAAKEQAEREAAAAKAAREKAAQEKKEQVGSLNTYRGTC